MSRIDTESSAVPFIVTPEPESTCGPASTSCLPKTARAALAEYARSGTAVHEVFHDSAVRVVSDEAITDAQAQAFAKRVEAAYAFDTAQQQWQAQEPLRSPLTVAVLSQGAFSAFTGDITGSVAGVTTGPDLFVVPDSVLSRPNDALVENTIAHELAHVQDFREGKSGLNQVPIYVQEGKAYVLGERYPLTEHLKNDHIAYVAGELAKVSADKARTVLAHFRTASDEGNNPEGFLGETLGALFVEFLRTPLSGAAHPDAIQRLAIVTEQTGQGQTFDKAFQAQFGFSLKSAEESFLAHLKRTEGDPSARFQGTLFDPGGIRLAA